MLIKASAPSSVLLVCLGNICRSPTAEEIFRQQTAIAGLDMKVDSAGTGDWHIGHSPDIRAQRHAKSNGYNISKLIARQVTNDDFTNFDLILAMDAQNLTDLQLIKDSIEASNGALKKPLARLALFSEEDPTYSGDDVPDPYQGNADDFEEVIRRIESSSQAWIESWKTS
ncbi:low molecular weight phosphotyrosine protein phosphatase [Psychrobacter sp. TAE2020]|uniref:low molecular weight protein-tyrosine-phosphatase n=1 Tax=Psychrobacter sp. TAE2020 TaxID=2846762 RepID=UPI001C0FF32C|nr:low molecular weight protein-tyrosine-phosphatase [Psychrobacter sp. TAE2020]MBU5615582.1 low molecular weight phosphotyrosine protein phosphatase [Psychrobacter sp. TAE2020]